MVTREIGDFNTMIDISNSIHMNDKEIMVQKNGKDDFVVVDADTYKSMKKDMQIKELLEAAIKASDSSKLYSFEEVDEELDEILNV